MGPFFRELHRFRLLVIAVAVGLLVVGAAQLREAPVDVLPEFSPTYAEIQTEALGLSAEEVEQLITVPLEANLLNGVEGVRTIRSESVPGLSSVVLLFEPGTDTYRARQLVEERLTQAHTLPRVSKPPTLLQPRSSSNRVLAVEISGETVSELETSVIARWSVRPRLLGVPGVANVAIWGLRDQQLQVQVDPAVLKAKGVTLNQVIRSAGNAQVVSPLSFLEASTPGNGGFIETPQQRLQVRHVLEELADPAQLGRVPVAGTRGRLRLSDVATTKVDHQPLIGDAVLGDGPGLLLMVEKFPGASTTQVTEGVEEALEELGPGLAGIRTDTTLLRPASYVDDAFGNVRLALGIALLLALALLGALRAQWRAVVLGLLTVPLSVISAAVVLRLLGEGINALVVAGLAVAVSVIVDDAAVLSHRVLARLRGASVTEAEHVSGATRPALVALTYAALVGLLVVAPVAVVEGRPGAFLGPMLLAYCVALLAALAVAVTVLPVLMAVLLRGCPRARTPSGLSSAYSRALARFAASGRPAALATVVLLVAGVVTLPLLDAKVLPSFQDRNLVVHLEAPPGSSSEHTIGLAEDLSRRLVDVPGVERVGGYVGRAITGDRVVDVSSGDVWVRIDADADHGVTVGAVERVAAQVAGARTEVVSYSTQKVRDVGALSDGANEVRGSGLDVLTGSDEPLKVRVYGEDPLVLQQQAERVRRAVSRIDGTRSPRLDAPPNQPTIEVEVDLNRAQQVGITPGEVRRAESALLHGVQVGSVFKQQKVFDVIVQGVPAIRRSVQDVRDLLVDLPQGGQVRLGQVADVRVVQRPAVIRREAVSRYADVLVPVAGRSVDAVAAEVRSTVRAMSFPLEYHAEVLRESAGGEIGAARAASTAAVALAGVFLLLQAAFRSWRLAGLAFLSLPLALAGGLVAVAVTGGELSLGSFLGLAAVLLLAARSGLLLVMDAQAPVDGVVLPASLAERVRLAAAERVAPVLATSGVLLALAVSLVILGRRPGLEILHPMAISLVGGLLTWVFVALVLLPAWCVHAVPVAAPPAVPEGEPRLIDVREPRQVANGRRASWDDGARL